MGYVIGTGPFPSTWRSMRTIAGSLIPPPPYPQPGPVVIGDHNVEYPASPAYLKTIEGNGLLRIPTPATPEVKFFFLPADPPFNDSFYATGFAEPYVEQLIGKTVTTMGSAFTITADAFISAQEAGSGGENPITVEGFQALT